MSCVQLSEGGFQVVYPLGLWSRSSGVVKVLYGYGQQTIFIYTCTYNKPTCNSIPEPHQVTTHMHPHTHTWCVIHTHACMHAQRRPVGGCFARDLRRAHRWGGSDCGSVLTKVVCRRSWWACCYASTCRTLSHQFLCRPAAMLCVFQRSGLWLKGAVNSHPILRRPRVRLCLPPRSKPHTCMPPLG